MLCPTYKTKSLTCVRDCNANETMVTFRVENETLTIFYHNQNLFIAVWNTSLLKLIFDTDVGSPFSTQTNGDD